MVIETLRHEALSFGRGAATAAHMQVVADVSRSLLPVLSAVLASCAAVSSHMTIAQGVSLAFKPWSTEGFKLQGDSTLKFINIKIYIQCSLIRYF